MEFKTNQCDLAIIGAGPHGMNLALWIKKELPSLQIIILEANKEFQHKIGESTLSGFCKAIRDNGISHEAFQSLFFTKKGLGYWFCDEENEELTSAPEYIIETFDETFQIERRVFDSLLEANCIKNNIKIIKGAFVAPDESNFSSNGNNLIYYLEGKREEMKCKIVVDASGPASILSNQDSIGGGYIPSDVPFQTSSVWAYFKDVNWLKNYDDWKFRAAFSRDEYTQHLCFKEGWIWYIPITSWQKSNTQNLNKMLSYLADGKNKMYDRDVLAKTFNCKYEQIWSIGISLRNDRDDSILKKSPNEVFSKYLKKIPSFGKMMEGARILADHYPNHTPYAKRISFRKHSKNIAGDGWLAIGDAAFFVDPLRSPGLLGGAAISFHAKTAIIKAFKQQDFGKNVFQGYINRIQELHEMMEDQSQISYLSHNHPKAITLARRFGEIASRGHFEEFKHIEKYEFNDTNVWGHLYTKHFRMQKEFLKIMLDEENKVNSTKPLAKQTIKDYENMVERLEKLISSHLEKNEYLNPYFVENKLIVK